MRGSLLARWPWLPVRSLLIVGGIFLILVFLGLVPLGILNFRESRAVSRLQDTIRVQSLFSPLNADFEAGVRSTQQLIGKERSLPAPENLAGLVEMMQQMAAQSGLQSASFVPISETVVSSRDQIRIDGTLSGSPDALRQFLVLLSSQSWINTMTFLNITPGGGQTTYEVGVWALFGKGGA